MGGLLEKARIALQGSTNPSLRTGESDISEDERRAILAEINAIVAKARDPFTVGPVAARMRRRDLLLPVLVNASAIVIIAAAALIVPAILGGRGQAHAGESGSALAGDSALVGSLKRESEQTIQQIESSLLSAQKERDALKAGADDQVRRRREELAASLNAQLAQERERLRAEGASSASAERQLRTLEQQRRAELERQVVDFQRQLDAELARRDAEIVALRARTSRGQEEQQRVAALAEQHQGGQLVLDQINGSYAEVGAAMQAGRWDEARARLDALGSYLDQPGVASLPAVEKRRTADLFLIGSLRRLAREESSGTQSSDAAAPAELKAALDRADVQAETARRDSIAAQKQEKLRAAAREKLRVLAESLSDTARKSSTSAAAAREELIALLQVKVDVREILLSDSVRAQHPDLALKLDRFLDLTAEVRRAEGRAAGMKDAAAVIDSLADGKTGPDLSPVLRNYNDEAQRTSFQKFLDALRAVFF